MHEHLSRSTSAPASPFPMRDARAGAFSCCADCAARDLDELLLERLVGIVMVALGVVLATWGNLA